jgi:hypothetical protein
MIDPNEEQYLCPQCGKKVGLVPTTLDPNDPPRFPEELYWVAGHVGASMVLTCEEVGEHPCVQQFADMHLT